MDLSYHVTDPFPQTSPDRTRLHPFYERLAGGELVTTVCEDCGHVPWPPRVVCPRCLSARLRWEALPRTGTVHGFTIQEGGMPPGFDRPLVFAVVDLGPVRVFTRLVSVQPEAVAIGMPVELVPLPVPSRPGEPPRHLPAFRPAAAQGSAR